MFPLLCVILSESFPPSPSLPFPFSCPCLSPFPFPFPSTNLIDDDHWDNKMMMIDMIIEILFDFYMTFKKPFYVFLLLYLWMLSDDLRSYERWSFLFCLVFHSGECGPGPWEGQAELQRSGDDQGVCQQTWPRPGRWIREATFFFFFFSLADKAFPSTTVELNPINGDVWRWGGRGVKCFSRREDKIFTQDKHVYKLHVCKFLK